MGLNLEKYKDLPTGNVCDANGRGGNMTSDIKPIAKVMKLMGPAFTVRCQPGDNLTLHKAIYAAPIGSVLVIDVHGFTNAGAFGDIMATACVKRGIAGIVMNGSCRDADDIEHMGFPVFCKALNPGGTVKTNVGELGQTIQCGGVVVKTGDLVFADRDGVVIIPFEKMENVLEKALEKNQMESKIKERILKGGTTLEIFGF